jgi:hypothetical protein
LKAWPGPFDATWNREKLFEWRRDDRDFELGDQLILLEWEPGEELYTGRGLVCKVNYMLRGRFGMPDGHCVMGIKPTGETTPAAWGIPKAQVKKAGR